MAKFAIVTQSNWGYLPGLNALLNSLDYQGNKDIDFHFVYDDSFPRFDPENKYLTEAQNTFDFKVIPWDLEELKKKFPSPAIEKNWSRWDNEFYKYIVPQLIANDYDAICTTDCDYMISGNIENYFKLVVGTDIIMTGNNPMQAGFHYNGADNEKYKETIKTHPHFGPVMQAPCFCDPKRNIEFYKAVWKEGHEVAEDVIPFNRALINTDRIKDVVVLPGTFWFTPEYKRVDISYREINGKKSFFIFEEKIMMIHRHWWLGSEKGEFHGEIITSPKDWQERIKKNVDQFHAYSYFLNKQWKLKIDMPLSLPTPKITCQACKS